MSSNEDIRGDWNPLDRAVSQATGALGDTEVGTPDESSFSTEVCKGHMIGNAAGIEVAWKQRLSPD